MESVYLPYGAAPDGTELKAKVSWTEQTTGGQSGRPVAILFHAGGLVLGSAEFVPKPQIQFLVSKDFVTVVPNYRLSPQVSARDGAIVDAGTVLKWVQTDLAKSLPSSIIIDTSRIAAIGYSSGGTLALSLAAKYPTALKAVTAFYPTLFVSDLSSSAHKPAAFMANAPDFDETPDNLSSVPPEKQVTEFPLAIPGTATQPRHAWMNSQLKHGAWIKKIQPDGDFAALDPIASVTTPNSTYPAEDKGKSWPPTMFVQGGKDFIPGSALEYVKRAVEVLKGAGVSDVQVEVVDEAGHMFDASPMIGTTDLGPGWEAVLKGLGSVVERV